MLAHKDELISMYETRNKIVHHGEVDPDAFGKECGELKVD
jgi:hypothetical protein